MISIIIPALNEEKFLPLLLNSIKIQNFSDYDIILADAGSKDKTIEIAKKFGCRIIPGGLPGKGRNEGAKVAKGEILFFLDADSVLPDGLLKNSVDEFNKKKLDLATFRLLPIPKRLTSTFFMNVFYNW
ncbi:MAG: glycosyltransferase, partial [Candidatus Staskawiczbacteria bacterium]|nr:glycosyltransferase [Candidatus Staskawiczbacteria bacterium]